MREQLQFDHMDVLSLPNEILDAVAMQAVQKPKGIQLLCKFSSACKRLWNRNVQPSIFTCQMDASLTMRGENMH